MLSAWRLTAILALAGTLAAIPLQETQPLQALYDQGTQAARAKDFAPAEKAFRAGFDAAMAAGDKGWAVRFAQSTGEVYRSQGRFKEAIPEFSRALSLYREQADKSGIARTLDALGQMQARLGQFADAGRALVEALSLYEASGDASRTAKERGSLADFYSRSSDFRAALETGFRALDEDEKLQDLRETARVLDILGNALFLMGQPENALRYYQRGLTVRQSGQQADLAQDLAFSYRNMGAALYGVGRYSEALEYYGKSLELGKAAGNWLEVTNSTINIGTAERALGQADAARKTFGDVLAIAGQHGLSVQEASALYALGDLYLASGDLDHALEFHQRALKIRDDGRRPTREVVLSLNRLALVLEERGDLKGAEQTHERALQQFEQIGAGISDPVQYGAYRRTSVILYPHYAGVLVKLGKERDALLISERSRGVGLARMAALNGANFVDLLSPEDAGKWQGVTARLGRASNGLRVLEETAAGPAAVSQDSLRATEKARALYFQTERELSDLRDRLFASTPGLRAAEVSPSASAAQLEALAKQSPETLFVEWMMVDAKSALLFALSAKGLEAFQLNVGAPELLAASNAWRMSMALSAAGRDATVPKQASEDQEEAQLAGKLYQLLFSKIEPLVSSGNYSRLVLVGDGPLLDLPFPALRSPGGARLIDRFAISTSVSLGYLLRSPTRANPVRSLLSVADPLAAGEHRLVVPSGDRYGQLEEALAEAKAVAAMYPGSLTLSGPAAREAEIKRRLPEYELLHFATHGVLDRADGFRSGLLLATEPGDSPEDGVLQAWEIAGMSLSARLVVLSACETGRGSERLGDGLLGLAWAFQAAGSPRVVASLWNVDDAATRKLMTSFYGELRKGARVDDAMRKSILLMRRDPRYASPYYWSAFEILGQAGTL